MLKSIFREYLSSLIVLALGFGLVAFSAITGYKYRVAQSVGAYTDRSLHIAHEIRQHLETLSLATTTVRNFLELYGERDMPPEARERIGTLLGDLSRALPNFGSIVVVDASGHVRQEFGNRPSLNSRDISDSKFFNFHKETISRGVFVSVENGNNASEPGHLVVSISARNPDGTLLGVIAARIEPRFFATITDGTPTVYRDTMFIKGPNGHVLRIYDAAQISKVDAQNIADWFQKTAANTNDTQKQPQITKTNNLLVVVPVRHWDMSFLSTTSMAPIQREALAALSVQIVLALALTCILAVFIGLKTRRARADREWAETVEQLKDRLAFATENAGIGIWTYEIADDELIWDMQMHKLYKRPLSGSPLRYDDWRSYLVPEMRNKVFTENLRVDTEDIRSSSFQIERGDGEIRWIQSNARVQRSEDGEAVRIIGVNFDTTSEVEAANRLEEERNRLAHLERRFRIAFEHVPHGTVISTLSGTIQTINSPMEEVFKRSKETLIGKNIGVLFSPSAQDAIVETLSHAGQSGDGGVLARDIEILGVRSNGEEFPLSVNIGEMTLGEEKLLIWSIDDQTERQAMEDRLRQAQRMEAVGQLTGGIAHDFNNILVTLSGSAELLEEQLDERPEAVTLLRSIQRSVDRATALTSRLLAFSRQQRLEPKAIDLSAAIADIQDLITRSLGESIELRTQIPENLWPAQADRNQFENALLNLCLNARDAMPEGGSLTISASNATLEEGDIKFDDGIVGGDYVLISVSDTGTGIPPETMKRIFEPFFTTKAIGKGSGLGLSMVYGFARQSGGQVTIYSEIGEGTTVRLYLPRATEKPTEEKAPPTAKCASGHPSGRILVVEDNDDVRSIPTSILASQGYDVLECTTASEALEILQTAPDVDLLFSDIGLPGGMTGVELAEEASKRNPKLKILLTTGYTQDLVAEKHNGAPIRKILTKPYRRRDLLNSVTSLLSAKN